MQQIKTQTHQTIFQRKSNTQIKLRKKRTQKQSKSRKSYKERLTLLMEHNLIDLLTGPSVLTQQE